MIFKKGFLFLTTICNGDALDDYSADEGILHLSWKTLSRAQLCLMKRPNAFDFKNSDEYLIQFPMTKQK